MVEADRSARPDLAVTAVIAAQTALAFVFDPRYHDFPTPR